MSFLPMKRYYLPLKQTNVKKLKTDNTFNFNNLHPKAFK